GIEDPLARRDRRGRLPGRREEPAALARPEEPLRPRRPEPPSPQLLRHPHPRPITTMSVRAAPVEATAKAPGFAEFVALVALTIGITALPIDNLLPAFSPIGIELGVSDPNRLQLLIYSYMTGFAVMQMVYGPLSDVWGRRPVLLSGLALYAVASLLAVLAGSSAF